MPTVILVFFPADDVFPPAEIEVSAEDEEEDDPEAEEDSVGTGVPPTEEEEEEDPEAEDDSVATGVTPTEDREAEDDLVATGVPPTEERAAEEDSSIRPTDSLKIDLDVFEESSVLNPESDNEFSVAAFAIGDDDDDDGDDPDRCTIGGGLKTLSEYTGFVVVADVADVADCPTGAELTSRISFS